jgi:hypothetical protein
VNDVEAAVAVHDGLAGPAGFAAEGEELFERADLAAGSHGCRQLSDIRGKFLKCSSARMKCE